MSFEADNRPRKSRSSLKARRSPGVIEHTIEEEDEGKINRFLTLQWGLLWM